MKKTLIFIILFSCLKIAGSSFNIISTANSATARVSFIKSKKMFSGKLVDTQNNNVGIAQDELCLAIKINKNNQKFLQNNLHVTIAGEYIILCQSGKVFDQVDAQQSCLTCTPGFLKPNYIGKLITQKSTPGLMGSGKQLNFYNTSVE